MRLVLLPKPALTAAALILCAAAVGCASHPKTDDKAPPASIASPAKKNESKVATEIDKVKAATNAAFTPKIECKHGGDTRTLEVRAKDKGCELAYTKNNQEAVVSSSSTGNAHCEASLNKIKGKLEAAGFTCK